jgi:hypothetical protein
MEKTVELDKKLTANQLFKIYKDEGGTLSFSEWLTREKTKGIFPLNGSLNEEVQKTIVKTKKEDMNKTVLGFPVRTLVIVGGVIVAAIIISKVMKKKA